MKILVPDYLLKAMLRHYRVLAKSYNGKNIKACNAQRMSVTEIKKMENIINKQKNG